MTNPEYKSPTELNSRLKILSSKLNVVIAVLLFLIGILIRIYSIDQTGAMWPIIGELGTFLSAIIAIPFIYEKFIRDEDRKLFLYDLETLIEEKLIKANGNKLTVHEEGRLSIEKKVEFFQEASMEIIEFGTSVRSFVGYFEQRSYFEFRQPIEEALKRGVNLTIFLLDPDSPIAELYSNDRNEPELIEKTRTSIGQLKKLQAEFREKDFAGMVEIYLYPHFPSCYLFIVDPKEDSGRMHISHYLHGLRRAEAPILKVTMKKNEVMFNKYYEMYHKIKSTSRKLT